MTITAATHAISVNPSNCERLAAMPWASTEEIAHALSLAANGYREWKHTAVERRAQTLRHIGQALRHRAEEMAQCISREMGKPIKQARGEVAKSAALCDWYAEHGPAMLNPEPTLVENNQAVIEYRPVGTILAIMPWNFPLWQVLRGAIPILLAGNGYLLKHAPNVTGCAAIIAQVFADAGVPAGVYGWVNADNAGVSQMINDPRIAAVTVTGSVRAGAAIGAQAGAALKKCVLELGVPIRLLSLMMLTSIWPLRRRSPVVIRTPDRFVRQQSALLSKKELRQNLRLVLWRPRARSKWATR